MAKVTGTSDDTSEGQAQPLCDPLMRSEGRYAGGGHLEADNGRSLKLDSLLFLPIML